MPPDDERLKGLRILVAEDELLVLMMLENMLRELGCQIVGPVATVDAALDAVVSHQVSVWLSYFILSALFLVIGILLMRKRYTPKEDL